MANRLPDLVRVAYREHETDDHPDGGYCLQLGADDAEGSVVSWLLLIGQYQHAFNLLADTAEQEADDGWALTRPVLFAAHHVCEVALKLVIAAENTAVVKRVHPLPELRVAATRLDRALQQDELEWIERFIALMDGLTHNGFEGRYIEIESEWCCLALGPLRESVDCFVALCVLAASAAG